MDTGGSLRSGMRSICAQPAYSGVKDVLTSVYKEGGIRALYRGIGAYVLSCYAFSLRWLVLPPIHLIFKFGRLYSSLEHLIFLVCSQLLLRWKLSSCLNCAFSSMWCRWYIANSPKKRMKIKNYLKKKKLKLSLSEQVQHSLESSLMLVWSSIYMRNLRGMSLRSTRSPLWCAFLVELWLGYSGRHSHTL